MISKYQLGGRTIKVRKVNSIKEKKGGYNEGEYCPDKSIIRIAKKIPAVGRNDTTDTLSKQSMNETCCHEIIHSWFTNMNEFDLTNNEPLVQKLGMALHQFLKTAQWDKGIAVVNGNLTIQ